MSRDEALVFVKAYAKAMLMGAIAAFLLHSKEVRSLWSCFFGGSFGAASGGERLRRFVLKLGGGHKQRCLSRQQLRTASAGDVRSLQQSYSPLLL